MTLKFQVKVRLRDVDLGLSDGEQVLKNVVFDKVIREIV